MNQDEHFRKLEMMYHSAPINLEYRPKLTVSEKRAEITMMKSRQPLTEEIGYRR